MKNISLKESAKVFIVTFLVGELAIILSALYLAYNTRGVAQSDISMSAFLTMNVALLLVAVLYTAYMALFSTSLRTFSPPARLGFSFLMLCAMYALAADLLWMSGFLSSAIAYYQDSITQLGGEEYDMNVSTVDAIRNAVVGSTVAYFVFGLVVSELFLSEKYKTLYMKIITGAILAGLTLFSMPFIYLIFLLTISTSNSTLGMFLIGGVGGLAGLWILFLRTDFSNKNVRNGTYILVVMGIITAGVVSFLVFMYGIILGAPFFAFVFSIALWMTMGVAIYGISQKLNPQKTQVDNPTI